MECVTYCGNTQDFVFCASCPASEKAVCCKACYRRHFQDKQLSDLKCMFCNALWQRETFLAMWPEYIREFNMKYTDSIVAVEMSMCAQTMQGAHLYAVESELRAAFKLNIDVDFIQSRIAHMSTIYEIVLQRYVRFDGCDTRFAAAASLLGYDGTDATIAMCFHDSRAVLSPSTSDAVYALIQTYEDCGKLSARVCKMLRDLHVVRPNTWPCSLYDARARTRALLLSYEDLSFGMTALVARKRAHVPVVCGLNGCTGMIGDEGCVRCTAQLCEKCMTACATLDGHVCDVATAASVTLILHGSQSCPKCNMRIERIDGCNDMFCTRCYTSFNYETGIEDIVPKINPHRTEYLERLRASKTASGQPVVLTRNQTQKIIRIHRTIGSAADLSGFGALLSLVGINRQSTAYPGVLARMYLAQHRRVVVEGFNILSTPMSELVPGSRRHTLRMGVFALARLSMMCGMCTAHDFEMQVRAKYLKTDRMARYAAIFDAMHQQALVMLARLCELKLGPTVDPSVACSRITASLGTSVHQMFRFFSEMLNEITLLYSTATTYNLGISPTTGNFTCVRVIPGQE